MKRFIALVLISLMSLAAPSWAVDDQREALQSVQVPFTGAWVPDLDPMLIGAQNYSRLRNLRYTDAGLEGVAGYTLIENSLAPSLQDFSAGASSPYTETDIAGDRITRGTNSLTVTDLDSDEVVTFVRDFGASYFSGDFIHRFYMVVANGFAVNGSSCYFWGMGDTPGSILPSNGHWIGLKLVITGNFFQPTLYADNASAVTSSSGTSNTLASDGGSGYWVQIERDESVGSYGQLTVDFYASATSTTSLETVTLAMPEKYDFRYLFAMSAPSGAGGENFDGGITDLSLQGATPQNGANFRTNYTTTDYTLLQVQDENTESAVYVNTTAVPSAGAFQGTALHQDASGSGLGRFSPVPGGGIAYCNGKENMIWAGAEMPVSGFYAITQTAESYTPCTFTAVGDTLTLPVASNAVTDGYLPGMVVTVSGTTSNNRNFTIASISDSGGTNNLLTFVEDAVVGEATSNPTLTASVATDGFTDSIDYTEAVNNTLTTVGNVAELGSAAGSTTKLLLHLDGSDGSTTITDSSTSAHTVTVAGNAKLATGALKFGTASGDFDGSGDYLTSIDSADWDLDTSKFTIDFWVRFNSEKQIHGLFSQQVDANNFVECSVDVNTLFSGVSFQVYESGVQTAIAWTPFGIGSIDWTLNQWYHIAIIRGWGGNADTLAITVDGTVAATTSLTASQELPNLAAAFEVGRVRATAAYCLDGQIDEFRFVNGAAKWTANFTPPSSPYTSGHNQWAVLSTRPLQGVKYYLQSANGTTSTTTGTFWDGQGFSALSNFSDGTASGGASLAQTGSMTWDSTVNSAKPLHFQGLYLYAYLFSTTDGSATVYHATADAPWQPVTDIWDGVFRQPIQFQVSNSGTFKDWTLEVNEPSYEYYPIGAEIGALSSSEHAIAMFDDRVNALAIDMIPTKVNTNSARPTVSYWSGSAWVTVSTMWDGTTNDQNTWESLGRAGLIRWSPPNYGEEKPRNLFGVNGYAYKIQWNATLSGSTNDAIIIDTVRGVPSQLNVDPATFPVMFGNYLGLAGFSQAKEGNRLDYCAPNGPNVWNGELTSDDKRKSLYFGDSTDITAAAQVFNRFGANLYASLLVLKDSHTYLLSGTSAKDWQILTVSDNVGCPAPLTLVSVESGYEMAQGLKRNVAIWMDYSGPMIFDGAVLQPIRGVHKYFDPLDSSCINTTYIALSRGWYDQTNSEYNLLIPSGTSATTCNLWLVYDMTRNKWYEKNTGGAALPTCAFPVRDARGIQYIYAGVSTGHLARLENGTDWNGTDIIYDVITGDFYPTGNTWDQTRIRRLRLQAVGISEDTDVAVKHFANTSATGTNLTAVALDGGANRVIRNTQPVNLLAWSHAVEYTASTGSTTKGFRPTGWGYQYQVERLDE